MVSCTPQSARAGCHRQHCEHQRRQHPRDAQRRAQRDHQQGGDREAARERQLNRLREIAGIQRIGFLLQIDYLRAVEPGLSQRSRDARRIDWPGSFDAVHRLCAMQRQQRIPVIRLMQNQRVEAGAQGSSLQIARRHQRRVARRFDILKKRPQAFDSQRQARERLP